MSFSQVRTYFKQRIAVASPDREEWADALNINDAQNVPFTELERSYHIQTVTVDTENQDKSVQDLLGIVVTIWQRGFNSPLDVQGQLLDEAFCIRHELINPRNYEDFGGSIDAVFCIDTVPSEIDASNDNIIQIQMTFVVELNFLTVPVT